VQCTLYDNDLHELMLVEDLSGDRQRSDAPICFAVLPNSHSNDAYHLVVSYQSMMIRWWQVSLTTSKLHSQVTLNAPVTHLTMFDWPSASGHSVSMSTQLPVEKPPGTSTGFKRGNTRFSVAIQGAARRQSVRVPLISDDFDHQSSIKSETSPSMHALASVVPVLGGLQGFIRQRASIKQRLSLARPTQAGLAAGGASSVVSPHDDFIVNKDQSCLCVIGFDVAGGMPILLARQGRIAKVYTCSDHFTDKGTKVDQLVCDGNTIAVQLSTGDIRHMEFVFEEEVVSIKGVPLDLPA